MPVSVSGPTVSDPPRILMVALPLTSVVGAEVYPPPVSVTVPVGVGFPVPPLTVISTLKACAVVMLDKDGLTVTLGVILTEAVALPLSGIV